MYVHSSGKRFIRNEHSRSKTAGRARRPLRTANVVRRTIGSRRRARSDAPYLPGPLRSSEKLQLFQLRAGQLNQRLDGRSIELKFAAGGGEEFRQRTGTAQR